MSQIRVQAAIRGIQRARSYTNALIGDFASCEWFWHPDGYVTHLAWQVGHLAFAQYCHCFHWIRGRQPSDESFMSERFILAFEMGSVPLSDCGRYPSVEEIHHVFDDIHARALAQLADLTDEELDVPLDPARPDRTKLGGLYWDAEHEFLHAGQIGMLRRLMGKPALC